MVFQFPTSIATSGAAHWVVRSRKTSSSFFADYEGTQQSTAAQLTTTVPTAAEKTGDFSGDPNVTLYNPFNFGTNCPAGAPSPCPQAIPNNMITAIDPVAQKYLQYWPSPTTAGVGQYHSNNFFAAGAQPETDQRFDVRLDDNITQAQHLFGRISIQRENDTSPNFFHNDFYARDHEFRS